MSRLSQIAFRTLQIGTTLGLLCLVFITLPANAQSRASSTVTVGLKHHEETFTTSRPSWREDALSVWLNASNVAVGGAPSALDAERRQRASIAFEIGRAERFGHGQEFGGIDFYRGLGERTYLNLRVRAAPRASVVPELDLTGNITSSFARVWEATAGYRLMRYRNNLSYQSISTYSIDGARYLGWWYFRARASLIPVSGSLGTAFVATARRYVGSADNLVEMVVANGREVVTGAADEVLDIRQSFSVVGRGQYYITRSVGVDVGLSYTRDSELSRWGVVAGVKTRF